MRKYNWGIIGAGSIAAKFASDLKLLPEATLYAIASRDYSRANAFAQSYGVQKAYGSYEELVENPAVDIIYIASRHVGHYPDTMLCLSRHKAVLVEKPISINEKQCRVMLNLAKQNKVFLMEALWTRFIPSFRKCKELVEGGAIGDITLIHADFCTKPPYDPTGRLFNPTLGGGSLLDIGLYPVFLSLTLAGKPIELNALASFSETGVDQTCAILFKHEKNILSVLYCSLINTGKTEAIIHGTKGMVRINTMWHIPTSVDLITNEGKLQHFEFEERGNGYEHEAAEVMRCLSKQAIQSTDFSWQHSIELIATLDKIREVANITYPADVEAV